MEQLTCKMCGSTDLVRQNGVYICQSCGNKYIFEENTTVVPDDVSKTEIDKGLLKARNSLAKQDWVNVEKEYTIIEEQNPRNIEAVFFSSFGKAMQTVNSNDVTIIHNQFKLLENTTKILSDYYGIDNAKDFEFILEEISKQIILMYSTRAEINAYILYGRAECIWNSTGTAEDVYEWMVLVEQRFIETIEKIIKKDNKLYMYKILLKHYIHHIDLNMGFEDEYLAKIPSVANKITELEPNYLIENKIDIENYISEKKKVSIENYTNETNQIKKSKKSWLITLVLCIFGGLFGFHRFYTGNIITGIIQMFSYGGFGVWWLYDLVMICLSKFKTGNGEIISRE